MYLFILAAVMFVLSIALSVKTPSLTEERDPQYYDVCPIIHETL